MSRLYFYCQHTSPSIPVPRELSHWRYWENSALFRDTEGSLVTVMAVLPRLIGKLDLDLRGECNAVKAIMKSLLKQDFNLCEATADCCREASN